MSRNGYKVMDSDMHVIEPADLFERYLDARFADRAPRISRAPGKRGGAFLFEGRRLPTCDVDNPHRMYGMSGTAWRSGHLPVLRLEGAGQSII